MPIDASAREAVKGIRNAELKEYEDAPHGLFATYGDELTDDLIAFLKG